MSSSEKAGPGDTVASGLKELRLSFNELSGQLPTEWSGLNALTAFSLQFNQNLSGTVPTQYDQLGSNLREALLDSTDLCGAYPPGWKAIRILVPSALPECTGEQPPPSPNPPSPSPPSLQPRTPQPARPPPPNPEPPWLPPPSLKPSSPEPPSQEPPSPEPSSQEPANPEPPSPPPPSPPPSPEPPNAPQQPASLSAEPPTPPSPSSPDRTGPPPLPGSPSSPSSDGPAPQFASPVLRSPTPSASPPPAQPLASPTAPLYPPPRSPVQLPLASPQPGTDSPPPSLPPNPVPAPLPPSPQPYNPPVPEFQPPGYPSGSPPPADDAPLPPPFLLPQPPHYTNTPQPRPPYGGYPAPHTGFPMYPPTEYPAPPQNCYTESEVVGDYEVVYSCYFCAGTPEDDPFSTFSPQLLDSYGNLQYISLLYDDVLPAAVLAVRSVYGSGSFLARVVTEGGSAFISDSPTITEERLNVTSGTGNTRPTVEARSSGHKELSAISVCCGQDGAVSQVAFRFSDGSMSSAGSCPGTSPSGALALQQGDAGAGVALPLTGGGAVAVPAGSGFRLSGVRGSRGAAVGAVSFAFARKLNRPSPPATPPAPPSPPAPNTPLLPPRPPSPPPPSPRPPPPPPSYAPQEPPLPPSPPPPTTAQVAVLFTASVEADLPVVAKDLPPSAPVRTNVPASTIVLVGPAVPIAVNYAGESTLATARYYNGRGIAFGAEKYVTACCRPKLTKLAKSMGKEKSDPGFDRLVRNLVALAAGPRGGGSGRNGSAVLRVAGRAYLRMARYVSNQLPDLLERYRRRANRRLLLSLGDFVQSKGDGVDIYVVAPYDAYDELAVRVLLQFAASGKSLIFVGPDVMPREFYPDADSKPPPVAGALGGDTLLAVFGVPPSKASKAAGDDPGGPGTDFEGERAGLPQLVRSRGRQLLQTSRPAFNASSIAVNEVSGPMGLYFSGTVSNPGSNLTVAGPVELQNAELAAQRYLEFVRGTRSLTPQELNVATASIQTARATTARATPGAARFWSLVDTADKLAATRPALPPVRMAPPPPPRGAAVPAGPPAAFPAPLPDGVSYVGCFPLPDPPALTTVLPADRTNSLQRCLAAARNLSASTSQRLAFVALQRAACLCAPSLPPSLLRAKAQDTACYLPCPGAQQQRCGGPSNGTQPLATVYRVVSGGNVTSSGGSGDRAPGRRPRAQGRG